MKICIEAPRIGGHLHDIRGHRLAVVWVLAPFLIRKHRQGETAFLIGDVEGLCAGYRGTCLAFSACALGGFDIALASWFVMYTDNEVPRQVSIEMARGPENGCIGDADVNDDGDDARGI